MAATATGSQPLHSDRVAVGTTQHNRDTVVWSEMRETVTLFLPPSLGEVRTKYCKSPVRLLPEVASTDKDKVLVLLQSPHGDIPNDYIVCSGQGGDSVRLPRLPEVFLPGSMGLLVSSTGSYLVAHLSVTHNQNTGLITQGSLHLWKSSPKTEPWTHKSVRLLTNLTNWHAHRVIPFNGTHLMWVDLKQGILLMSPSDEAASLEFVGLPCLPDSTKPWRNDRPEMFRSVGCCSGEVKLVNLHIPHGSTTNDVVVDIWTLLENGNWSKDYNDNLNCRNLWDNYRNRQRTRNTRLPPWPNSVPISPFLREDNSNILCLTVVEEKNNKAWLLQISIDIKTQTITLKHVTEYPSYYSHMKQPFLINSSSITRNRTMILWPLLIHGESFSLFCICFLLAAPLQCKRY